MKRLLLAGLIAGAWSSCALAADLGPYNPPPRYEPVYEPVRDMATTGKVSISAPTPATAGAATTPRRSSVRRRHPVPSVRTVGSAADRSATTRSSTRSCSVSKPICRAPTSATPRRWPAARFTQATTDIEWFSTLRGRIGYAAGPALLYVTGGWAFADVSTSVTQTTGGGSVSMSSDDIKTGYTLGGGVEWAFAPNWSLKTEYLYVDLGKRQFVDARSARTRPRPISTPRASASTTASDHARCTVLERRPSRKRAAPSALSRLSARGWLRNARPRSAPRPCRRMLRARARHRRRSRQVARAPPRCR